MKTTKDCPGELAVAIESLWPESEWSNAASIAFLESAYDPFAVLDTTNDSHPCGSFLDPRNGLQIMAEKSIGYFQINACVHLVDNDAYLFNAEFNAGLAYDLWSHRGWWPWYFSAKQLGLI